MDALSWAWLHDRAAEVAAGAAPVPSPCISVCLLDEVAGGCSGCLRTLDEIGRWGGLDDAAKRSIWALIAARLPAQSPTETLP